VHYFDVEAGVIPLSEERDLDHSLYKENAPYK
jgi:hypothetical protein